MSAAQVPPKAVRLADGERGEPIVIKDFQASIVGNCADALAMHARDRATLPRGMAREAEAQIRRQREAVLSLGGESTAHVASWWEHSDDSADHWKTWAALFLIAAIGGPSLCDEIRRAFSRIPDDDGVRWAHAAEAVALVPTSDAAALGRALAGSSSAAARAVGVDLLSRFDAIPADVLKEHLRAAEPAVAASAARATARAGFAKELAPELLRCTRSESAVVAWEAARALTLAGVREPYLEIQGGGALVAVLGARGVEILVMAGEDLDIAAFEALIAETPMTPELLSAVGRFGNVTAWSFLLHFLADADLADAAVDALRTLFGDLVPEAEATSFAAWKRAIAEAELNPVRRYRGGKLWRPAAVVEELRSTALSRPEAERRVDELAARTGIRAAVDLGLWEAEARVGLAAFGDDVQARDGQWRPGAWR